MRGRAKEILEKILQNGEAAIDGFIADREAESLFLDFKRSADDGNGKKLHQNDRSNLARAISGFGNSEGGLVIWGIDCREGADYADVARAKFPLEDARRFLSWLEGAVSSTTIPAHSGVEHYAIRVGESEKGFVITYIPKSNHAPHQVIASGKGQHHYYIRVGSDFAPTPHAVLSGMFGRRPQPFIFETFTTARPKLIEAEIPKLKIDLGIQIANGGQGIATDLFMSLKFISKPGSNCTIEIQTPDLNNWTAWSFMEFHCTTISKDTIKLPPDAQLQPFVIELVLEPPFEKDLKIEGLCGCGQSESFSFSIENEGHVINKLYNDFLDKSRKGDLKDWTEIHGQFDFWNLKEKAERAKKVYT
jgi:hypothetical protein